MDLQEAVWDGVDDERASECAVGQTPWDRVDVAMHNDLGLQLLHKPVECREPLVCVVRAVSNAERRRVGDEDVYAVAGP